MLAEETCSSAAFTENLLFGLQGSLCAADALPSPSDPPEEPMAQHASHGQTTGQHDAVTGTDPSSSLRDGSATLHAARNPGTSGNGSRKKRDGTFVDEQQSKRHRAHSQSQTDTSAGPGYAVSGAKHQQKGKHDGQLNGQHDGQQQTNVQPNGQLNGERHGQQQTNGQPNGQLNGQDNGQQQTNGQHNTGGQGTRQAEARNNAQRNISGGDPTHTQVMSKVRPHLAADSEAASDSSLDSKLEDEDEEARDTDSAFMQLGNINIAAASGGALSVEMLQGLKAGLHARLSLYATESMAGDKQQLKEVQEGYARYRKLTSVASVFRA